MSPKSSEIPTPPDTSPEEQERINARALTSVQETLDAYAYIFQQTTPVPTLFDLDFITNVELVSATVNPPDSTSQVTVLWNFHIPSNLASLNGLMHGGAAGVIFDVANAAVLCPISRKGYWDFMGGVTRSLNINYLKPVPINSTVRIRCELVQVGRTMAMIEGFIESLPVEDDAQDVRTVYATCTQHKVNVPSQPHHLKLREEMRLKQKRGEWKRPEERAKL